MSLVLHVFFLLILTVSFSAHPYLLANLICYQNISSYHHVDKFIDLHLQLFTDVIVIIFHSWCSEQLS